MQSGGNGSRTRTRELLERWLAGDSGAERRLFERYRALLVERARSARWMRALARHAAPEDLVDEVFLRAFASGALAEFDCRGEGALERFLAKLLDSVAIDALRRHGRLKRGAGRPDLSLEWGALGEPGSLALTATDTTPTGRARAEDLTALCRSLLSDAEWEVFRLCELEGRSSVEVGERLGTSAAAVRGTLFRARQRILRAWIERGWLGEDGAGDAP